MIRVKRQFPYKSGITGVNEFLYGNSDPVIVTENGLQV